MNIFSRAVNKAQTIEAVIDEGYPHFLQFLDAIREIEQRYQARKELHRFLDYDDLLVRLKDLLSADADLCQRIAGAYRFIMVDEYQDTNQIQADILRLLAGSRPNLMVVGDDSQSIYAFRGANFRNIMAFPDQYAGTRVIRLEENYRSVQPILNLTNALIAQAAEKFTKHLFTNRSGGALPRLVRTNSENEQSRLVVDEIRSLLRQDVAPGDIAVLFRAGYHAFDLEIELAREGLSFVKVGGFKFMEAAHIKDLLAHLRVMTNPTDRISWHRILLLVEKIGAKTAQTIFDAIVETRAGTAGLMDLKLPPRLEPRLAPLKALYQQMGASNLSVAQMGEAVLAYYLPVLKENYEDHPKRARDLEQLLAIMERYGQLDTFLADMALEPPDNLAEGGLHLPQPGDARLTLSTIHSAKGLEWHSVFIIWALDGRFPFLQAIEDPEQLDEELRLMYVAATRARENLTFVCPMQAYDRATEMVLEHPSRFLDDLPEEILQRVGEPSDAGSYRWPAMGRSLTRY